MAQEQSANPFYDFMYGRFLIKDLFDIVIQEDDYVEKAYNIFRDIGNIATATHAYEFTIDESSSVDVPCNAEFIEAVSTGQSWVNTNDSTIIYHIDRPNYYDHIPDVITSANSITRLDDSYTNLHPNGEYINYTLEGTGGGRKMVFDKGLIGQRGVCIYRGMCLDADGNPLLTRKEADAIAYKLAYLDTLKRAFKKEPGAGQMLEFMKNEMGTKMQAAKIPEYITQNEWDRILTASTRHDRKVFWSSYKSLG
tara:strand:+ start:142 stop:897 length:756 start_codon:yes stop_codon:yes gene_type:complete